MNLAEAKKALNEGEAISHRLFQPYEFIRFVDGKLEDEDRMQLDEDYFWGERQSIEWQSGWELF